MEPYVPPAFQVLTTPCLIIMLSGSVCFVSMLSFFLKNKIGQPRHPFPLNFGLLCHNFFLLNLISK